MAVGGAGEARKRTDLLSWELENAAENILKAK